MSSDDRKIEDFIFRAALYTKIKLDPKLENSFLRSGQLKLRGYCIGCGVNTIYYNVGVDPMRLLNNNNDIFDGNLTLNFQCQKNPSHKLGLSLNVDRTMSTGPTGPRLSGLEITKTGQFPSMIDLSREQYSHLEGIMAGIDYSELNRAVGLASHGANVAAFVYLRRIFERIIYSTADEHELSGEDFNKLRMAEKVKALKSHLPEIISTEVRLYPSLSAGLHSWSEEECSSMFEILREAILLIFEEKKTARELAERREKIQRALNNNF